MRGLFLVPLLIVAGIAPASAEPSPDRQQELLHLLAHDCGSCHGMTLRGGLGPALTAGALRNKPAPYLEHIVLAGRAGTPMPPWRQLLSAEDVHWLIAQLKAGDTARD